MLGAAPTPVSPHLIRNLFEKIYIYLFSFTLKKILEANGTYLASGVFFRPHGVLLINSALFLWENLSEHLFFLLFFLKKSRLFLFIGMKNYNHDREGRNLKH